MSEIRSANYHYALGVHDCANGTKARLDMPEQYYSGYGDQYSLEQKQSRGFN